MLKCLKKRDVFLYSSRLVKISVHDLMFKQNCSEVCLESPKLRIPTFSFVYSMRAEYNRNDDVLFHVSN